MISGRGQQPSRLGYGKHAGLAKHVGEARQPFGGYRGIQLVRETVDPRCAAVRPFPILKGHLVRPKAGRHDVERTGGGEAPNNAQGSQLVVHGESVPRLNFHRGHAACGERLQPRHCASEEVVVAARAQIAHRGVDPAATTRDLKIRHPRGA